MTDYYFQNLPTCRHGYEYNDCPMACLQCGHRCELHQDGACLVAECPCLGWQEEDDDE